MNHRLTTALSGRPARTATDERAGPVGAGRGGLPPAAPMPGPLVLDLVAAVVQSGAPPHSALAAVGAALREASDPRGDALLTAATQVSRPDTVVGGPQPQPDRAGPDPGAADAGRVLAAVRESLFLAARSGLPPTELVRRAAAEERRRQISAQLRAIRKLEVLLVIPAGLCLLPAFVLLGIVPLVIDLITG